MSQVNHVILILVTSFVLFLYYYLYKRYAFARIVERKGRVYAQKTWIIWAYIFISCLVFTGALGFVINLMINTEDIDLFSRKTVIIFVSFVLVMLISAYLGYDKFKRRFNRIVLFESHVEIINSKFNPRVLSIKYSDICELDLTEDWGEETNYHLKINDYTIDLSDLNIGEIGPEIHKELSEKTSKSSFNVARKNN